MTRPILWAIGTLAALAALGAAEGGRLAARFRPDRAPEAPLPAVAAGSPVVTVAADLVGHFIVHPEVDGRRLRMMLDTGASLVALSHEDAVLAGIRVDRIQFGRRVSTANGTVEVAPYRIRELRIGDIVVRDVEAVVLPPGRLQHSLLGMSFLRRLKGFEIGAGRLTLKG